MKKNEKQDNKIDINFNDWDKKYPIVKVVWRDSNIYERQESIEMKFMIEYFYSVGHLVSESGNDNSITVTRDLATNAFPNDLRGTIKIPKENIIIFEKLS